VVRRREVLTLALCSACATAGGPRVSTDDCGWSTRSHRLQRTAGARRERVVIHEGRVVVRRA